MLRRDLRSGTFFGGRIMAKRKEMTKVAVFKAMEQNTFLGELMAIMRTGEYELDQEPIKDDEIWWRDMDPVEKAMTTLIVKKRREGECEQAKAIQEALWLSIKEADPVCQKAFNETDTKGLGIRRGGRIVFLPPYTEEEKIKQFHREMAEIISKAFGPMPHNIFDNPFGVDVHVVRVDKGGDEPEEDKFSPGGGFFKNLFGRS